MMYKNRYRHCVPPLPRVLRLAGAALLGLALALPVVPAAAQTRHLQVSRAEIGREQQVKIELHKSLIIDLPAEVGEVIVSQPEIALAIMRSKQRAIIQGVAAGETNIFFLDAMGRTISVLDVAVQTQPSGVASALEQTLARILPGSRIRVDSVALVNNLVTGVSNETNRVVLSGTAQSTDDIEKAIQIAAQFAGSAENVASAITVSGAQQVMLKVTVAEVSREALKQLGINLNASLTSGVLTTSLFNSPTLGGASNVATSNGLSAGFTAGGFSLTATLNALERRGASRTLAEPTLTAMSGQEAEFLAGGEFPVPTGYDPDTNTITFAFKEFGVNLKFTPVVKSNGAIAMSIETKVSEPTTEGGFSTGAVTIPATKERMAKTSVEMNSGGTLAIAGLIEDKVRQQFNALPGVGNLPIIGALFRSRDFVHSQTELLIAVTPYLAQPAGVVDLPTDRMVFAGDAEAYFLGHMEKLYGVGGGKGAGDYQGSIGFVLD